MDEVFRALADPNRRLLLDRLRVRDGQTLGELAAALPEMTRQGVTSHLDVLVDAGVVTVTRAGRSRHHHLNPVPIADIADRWVSRFAAPVVGAMAGVRQHAEGMPMTAPDHVYTMHVRASAERVWAAITDPDLTSQYYYGTRVSSTWEVGAPVVYAYPDGTVAADGEVLEVDPPHRVRLTFHARWDPELEAEGPTTMTWEAAETDGLTRLTVTVEGMRAGGRAEADFTQGLPWIVSGLKTLLETDAPMAPAG